MTMRDQARPPFCLLCILLLACCLHSSAQPDSTRHWISLLKDDSKEQALTAFSVYNSFEQHDSNTIIRYITALEKATANASLRLQTRVKTLKAKMLFYNLGPGDSLYAATMKDALAGAYTLNDPWLIAECSRWYGEMLNTLGNRPLAAQYCMNALKMKQELGFQYFPTVKTFYLTTAEMLHRTMNYPEAIRYYQAAFTLPDDSLNPKRYKEFKEYLAHCMIALGKSYYHIKQYDSAIQVYHQCMQYIRQQHLPDDQFYIASDNRFDPYIELGQYDSCKRIAADLYEAGLPADSNTLMAACFMKGRIALRQKNYTDALQWGLQAEQYGQHLPPKLLYQVYKDLAATCEQLNQKDKALAYLKKFQELETDNILLRRNANAAYLEAESEFQKSKVMLSRLSAESNARVRTRTLLLAAVALLASLSILYFYNKRKRAEQARRAAEEKYHFFQIRFRSAEEQLQAFRDEVTAKNQRIETLLAEKNDQQNKRTQLKQVDDLSRQIILTEGDWELFKKSFDEVYPGFYTTLRQTIPGITNAEARMACLIKLNFDAKHIAGMLGISHTSVRKTRYRLKKRFGDHSERSLEEVIAEI